MALLERLLVLKEMLVQDPEVGLSGGRFGSRRGGASVRMNLLQWEVAVDKPQTVLELALQRMDTVPRHARVRALVVAVLEQCYVGGERTLDVVLRCDWHSQSCRRHRIHESAPSSAQRCSARRTRTSEPPARMRSNSASSNAHSLLRPRNPARARISAMVQGSV